MVVREGFFVPLCMTELFAIVVPFFFSFFLKDISSHKFAEMLVSNGQVKSQQVNFAFVSLRFDLGIMEKAI